MTSPAVTRIDFEELRPISWAEAEPARLERDQRDVAAFDPGLQYLEPGTSLGDISCLHGGWYGTLPLWPFDRPAPDGLETLTANRGLEFALTYPAAYPMVHPEIRPLAPEPEMVERTQATWHVLPEGGLCLLQSEGAWLPEASLVELLLKAAGWRVEYALMKAHVIEKMALSGIVSDASYDHLVTIAAETPTAAVGQHPATPETQESPELPGPSAPPETPRTGG